MKIFISANTTWFVYNFRRCLINELIKQGHEVIVFAPKDRYVESIEKFGARHLNLSINNSGTNPIIEAIALLRLAIILGKERPKLIYSNTPKINIYLSLASSLIGIPIIATVCGLGSGFLAGGLLKKTMFYLYKFSFRHPIKVFFENQDDRKEFIRLNLVKPDKTEYVSGSGVNLDHFQRKCHKEKNSKFVFLLAARLLWDKGVGEFVNAARLLKMKYQNIECHLLGFLDVDNPTSVSRSQIEKWESEGIIQYKGATDDVRQYFNNADCIVLPSYREGNPKTLLEAASMSIPIITTDVVGCRDTVVNIKTGLLCKVKNHIDLSEKMEQMLLFTQAQRNAMGEEGRKKMIQEFDERIVVDKYTSVIADFETNKESTVINIVVDNISNYIFRFLGKWVT